ncbi:UNVERIFIED_CONTAM: protein EXORDIUM-like 2 [Sesamum angustifolium]|uniref:Protein EXORDIUM-like 2 n=1 Tax=Sesamum angustifolium TaxID=2727405 RepID=A0AAW2IZ63_9LAMI
MACNYRFATVSPLLLPLFVFLLFTSSSMAALVQQQPLVLKYHNGLLLKGTVTVNLIWYGEFTPVQRSVIVDFLQSLNSPAPPRPSVSSWWKTTENYKGGAGSSAVVVGKQFLDENYSLGKSLKNSHIVYLARVGTRSGERRPDGERCRRRRFLQEQMRQPRVYSGTSPVRVRVGGELRNPVPRLLRVAVPPAAVRAADAAPGSPERRRGGGRHGDQPSHGFGGNCDEPVQQRVFPGPAHGSTGGGQRLHGRVRVGRLPGVHG